MRVATRLVLMGAVLPTAGVVAAALVAGQVFAADLLRSVDEGLERQAAVERVSLFDGPGGEPHLHIHDSPQMLEPTLSSGLVAVYGPDGAVAIRFPENAEVPTQLAPEAPARPRSVLAPGAVPRRELVVNLVSRDGRRYTLWLAQPLDGLRATTRAFYRATLSVCVALALLLFALQLWQARRLSRRIGALSAHLPRLREGDFDSTPPPDAVGDEVTELRAALVEVTAQLKAARERQERLIANAAHELRTPLGLMRTEMDLALRRERPPDELRAALLEARGEVDRLAALAQQLLDLAAIRAAPLARHPGDLAALVDEALDACRAEAEARHIVLERRGLAHAATVFAATRVRQAVDNLLSNALRHAPARSTIEVTIAREEERWQLRVSDAGTGVAEADRERIFEPFWRARSDGSGAGLGLAIVREVAREHGGACWLAPGARTEFILALP